MWTGLLSFFMGIALMLLDGGPRLYWGLGLALAGAALTATAGYYWTCGNQACSPPDA